jgi:hypothetical protein
VVLAACAVFPDEAVRKMEPHVLLIARNRIDVRRQAGPKKSGYRRPAPLPIYVHLYRRKLGAEQEANVGAKTEKGPPPARTARASTW